MDTTPPQPPPAPGRATLVAVGLAGTCAMLNLYVTQPILPLLARVFAVGKAQAALTVSAPPIAVALASPFVGALADRVGRRRVILASLFLLAVPTALAATSSSIGALVAWRFLQGLVVPGIHAVAIAYIGQVWARGGMGPAMAALVTGNVIGGFTGRFLSGLIAARFGWRASFLALGALSLAGSMIVWRSLPEPGLAPRRAGHGLARRSLAERAGALATGRLVSTYAVAFNVLFTLVATFTYVTFYLSEPPFLLGQAALASIFAVYLAGAVVTPFVGRWIERAGPRVVLVSAVACGILGGGLTLVHHLAAVGLGLALVCSASFACQSASTSFLQRSAAPGAQAATSGVYISIYYLGGSVGGVAPALAWHAGGWPACIALLVAVQLVTISIAWRFWDRQGAPVPMPVAPG